MPAELCQSVFYVLPNQLEHRTAVLSSNSCSVCYSAGNLDCVLAGSFLASGRLEMSEMSEVSVELRVYAVRERKCWTETEILDVLKEVEDYALDSPLPLFSAYDKVAEKFRTALEARIRYRHLLVQVSEGDRPPKDTSEEEIEEWNASAVIVPSVDPGYGTYVRMWNPIPAPWPGSPGSPVVWCLSRESDSPEF